VTAIVVQPEPLSICRLPADAPIPPWATGQAFFTVSRTSDELSIVCASALVPANVLTHAGWRALKLVGPFDLLLVGVLLGVAAPLAAAGVTVFPIATYDTDYLLVRHDQLDAAIAALRGAGHDVSETHDEGRKGRT
jgi:hypothetical protein